MESVCKTIELWSDSFHEGDWACENLAALHEKCGGNFTREYKNGFIPTYRYNFGKAVLEIIVYGSYGSWEPAPLKIEELIKWGKPDFIAYDPAGDNILFAVEETAAVPTGNQALQRCERLYGSARSLIPFWYLLAEYGVHKDGANRRDSIWPSIMALKLSAHYRTPCAILHYADSENPEGYDFGTGVRVLFEALYKILCNFAFGLKTLDGIEELLSEHYADMCRFIKSQHKNIIDHIPELHVLTDKNYPLLLAKLAVQKNDANAEELEAKFPNFLVWPNVAAWKAASGLDFTSSRLIKFDPFAKRLEKSIDDGKSYIIGTNAGSKPQDKASVAEWIEIQNKSFENLSKTLDPPATFELKIGDFPRSDAGNLHLTTAKNILYLFDRFGDLKDIIGLVFPRLENKLENYKADQKTLLYVSNSLKPGRIFGDPFTGQISAYSTAFGRFDKERRLVVAYFPHQSFAQIIDWQGRLIKNKGFVILREMVDVIVFGGGVLVQFDANGRAVAL